MHQPAATRLGAWAAAALLALGAACSGDDDGGGDNNDDGGRGGATAAPAPTTSVPVTADNCVVWLHGRGDGGRAPEVRSGIAYLSPSGNGAWQDRRQWLYSTSSDLAAATAIVTQAIDSASCDSVVLHGFSNGGAFAAKLYCGGDDFAGRLRGVIIDDPVTDASANACSPHERVDAVLYWTTAMESRAPTGTVCEAVGWTCEGPVVLGVHAYAEALGLPITPSVHTEHAPYTDSPAIAGWLAGG